MAPAFRIFLAATVLVLFFIPGILGKWRCHQFTIDPPFIRVTRTGTEADYRVTLICLFDHVFCNETELVQIRKSLNGVMTAIIQIDSNGDTNTLGVLPDSKEIEIDGGREYGVFLKISFVKAACDDEALYQCFAQYKAVAGIGSRTKRLDLYLSLNGPMTLTLSSESEFGWNVGDDVTMTCTGPAPKNETQIKNWEIDFVWEVRDPGNDTWYPVNSSTVSLTEHTTPTFANNPNMYCGRIVSEAKKIRLREEDIGREVQCYMMLIGKGYQQYNASVTLRTRVIEGGGDKGGDDKEILPKSGWSLAMVGGLGAGGVLLALGLGALACFLKGRRGQQPAADPASQEPSRDTDRGRGQQQQLSRTPECHRPGPDLTSQDVEGEASHHTGSNDAMRPVEASCSEVSVSMSEWEEPSSFVSDASNTSEVSQCN